SVVAHIVQLIQFTLPAEIELIQQPSPEPVSVSVNRFPAEQILLELVASARDGMPRGGTLTLESFNSEVDEAFSRDHPTVPPGAYGVLRVSDKSIVKDIRDAEFPSRTLLSQAVEPLWLEGLNAATRLAGGYLWWYS